ncbi:MAG: glycosyltransferase, partial [Rhodoferax sp.]|uniref:glycosyltransferase n=1 Tax=Rhodoferax sp. TaxID=50421 RepID=UPI0032646A27
EPTYLEKCVWFLESYLEFSFVNSNNVYFGEQNFLWTSGFEKREQYLHVNSAPPFAVIRRAAWEECGGFDDTIRVLYEDWDFWLAMAKCGHWGYTIPEFLQWYRKLGGGRYEQILQSGYEHSEFARVMQEKYPGLENHFPHPSRHHPQPYESIETTSLITNPLAENPSGRRLMFILPWMVTGGADRVNLDLIEGLTAKGHDVTVCATLLTDHRWEYLYTHLTPDVFVLPNFLSAADYPRFLAYLIRSRQIDTVVITGSTIGYQILPFLRAVSSGVAFVDMCHVEEPHWWNGGHPRFGIGYQDMLDLNIVTTQHLAKWMQERGADGGRIKVMYTGVRSVQDCRLTDFRDQIRGELSIPQDIPLIVFAGRICEQKRPLMLAKILKEAHDRGLKFNALVLGDGEQRAQLEDLLTQYGLSKKVKILGSVSHQRWLDILIASDIFLMPSKYEGISIALLEAMAAGVVPVVARVGGQEEILTPDAGMLIQNGVAEIEEYVNALERLLSNSEDLEQMSIRCRSIATAKLSFADMINNFDALLDESHKLRIEHPRHSVSPNFGRELALQTLEYRPLGSKDSAIERLRNMGIALIPDSLVGAAFEGNLELASLLIEAGVEPNARDRFGNCPLVEASWRGYVDVVAYLCDHRADVDSLTSAGLSALSAAVSNQQPEVVHLLLNRGANPNVTGPDGSTPLIDAAWRGSYNTVRELLLNGAHPNYRRVGDGVTALQVAVAGNQPRVAHLLRAVWATE